MMSLHHIKGIRRWGIAVLVVASIAAPVDWESTPVTAKNSFTSGIEGPACDAAGNLYAVNFARQGTLGKVTPDGTASLFVTLPDGGAANGLRFDSHGFLLAADYVKHHVWRIEMPQGRFVEDLAADWKGAPLHQPNDLGISSDDTIYFSDPDWSAKKGGGRIFMITKPPKRKTVLLDDGLDGPNGITVSADDRYVYVGESIGRRILQYERRVDGTLANKKVWFDFDSGGVPKEGVPDGIRCDVKGNLYVTVVRIGKVLIIRPDGKLDSPIRTQGKNPANITFCGPDGRTVYITEKEFGRVEKARVEHPGTR
ncbi:MAG: SMP-30/gluconolactonase/LRE family protein [Bryobacteraceae bacterium]